MLWLDVGVAWTIRLQFITPVGNGEGLVIFLVVTALASKVVTKTSKESTVVSLIILKMLKFQ